MFRVHHKYIGRHLRCELHCNEEYLSLRWVNIELSLIARRLIYYFVVYYACSVYLYTRDTYLYNNYSRVRQKGRHTMQLGIWFN